MRKGLIFTLVVSFCALLGATPATAQERVALPQKAGLQDFLDRDGRLSAPAGTTLSLDGTGYRIATDGSGAPRFLADGDENWDDRFAMPGIGYGTVMAMALDGAGNLYIGGSFGQAGGAPASYIARWNGRTWSALGAGVDGWVYSIATDGDNVYVGGDFKKAGTSLVNGVARWDGEAWHALGAGLEGTYGGSGKTLALAVLDGQLFVGGEFAKAGGVDAPALASWDGARWAAVGGQISTGYSAGTVSALLARGTDLFVGGRFLSTDGVEANSVARWSTVEKKWFALGDGFKDGEYGYGYITALAATDNSLFAGGKFDRSGTVSATSIARWDFGDQTWSPLAEGVRSNYGSATVQSLVVANGVLYAGGDFKYAGTGEVNSIARWENGAWSPIVSDGVTGVAGYSGVPSLLTDADGNIFVGGDFDLAGKASVNRIARWEPAANRWQALGEGVSNGGSGGSISAVAVANNGDVYVGGYFTYAGSAATNYIARWDGTAWHALGTGTNGSVASIVIAGDDVYVGGSFTRAGERSATYVARWNSRTETWSALGSGVSGSVSVLAYHGGILFAGGSFSAAGNVAVENIAKWDGQNWSALGAGVSFDGRVSALTIVDGLLFVGGDFWKVKTPKTGDWVTVNALTAWDSAGDDWYSFGAGLTRKGTYGDFGGSVKALALVGRDLYVGGYFEKAGTVAAYRIARFNVDTGWAALDSNVGGGSEEVNALLAVGTDLYAGGVFENAGDETVWHVARWNGAGWTALGSGVAISSYTGVNALASRGDKLYVGGGFDQAGGKPSARFASWTLAGGVVPAPGAEIAVTPAALDFGDVTVGETSIRTFTISNAAGAAATLSGTVGAPGGPFTVVQGGGIFALAPGASREVQVRFAPEAGGEATSTISVIHDAANTGNPVTVTLRGTGKRPRRGMDAVTRNFDPAGPQLVWTVQDGGFVFGTNAYGDRAKGTALEVPAGKTGSSGTVSSISVWFGHRSPAVTSETYTLSIYSGSAGTGPSGSPLYTGSFPLSEIKADADSSTPEEPTVHVLSEPVDVDGSFFVTVDFGSYTMLDLATVAAGARLSERVEEVWEQWKDGTWHNVSDAWSTAGDVQGWQLWIEASLAVTVAGEAAPELPSGLTLQQNYPNPFNPSTTIRYTLDRSAEVRLRIYDLQGRVIATLVDGVQPAGGHEAQFDARDLASGTYLYRLETPLGAHVRRMVLLR